MKKKRTINLFDNWDETIIWSCLQGIMGEVVGKAFQDGLKLK